MSEIKCRDAEEMLKKAYIMSKEMQIDFEFCFKAVMLEETIKGCSKIIGLLDYLTLNINKNN